MAFMGQRLIEFGKQGVLVAAAEIFDGFEYFGFYQRNAYLQRSPYSTSLALGKDSLANVSFFKTINYYLFIPSAAREIEYNEPKFRQYTRIEILSSSVLT